MSDTTPEPQSSTDERYEEARKRVRKLREFYTTLGAYVVINLMLFVINLVTRNPSGDGSDGWWFYWVTIFWGVGIVFYAMSVFGDRWGKDWEKRKIDQYMNDG